MAPGSTVPVTVSVLSLVSLSVALEPVSSPTLVTTRLDGAVRSTVTAKPELAGLVLPATSVALAVKVCTPSVSAPVAVSVQLPWASAVTVPTRVVPS